MQDSDPRPASNRCPTLKSIAVSHFRKSTCNDVTDVCSKWNYNGEAIRTDSRWGILDDKREKKKKTVGKDQNAETFWEDMSYIVLITKAKEENPYWGPKKLLSELKLGYTERTAKGMLALYFYDTEVG